MRLKPDTLAVTVCLALLTALGPLSTDMYLPSLPTIARDLRATTAQTQATLSAFLLGFAAGQFVYGPVSDKVGRKPMMLAGLALFLAASVACTLAPSIETLTVARFFQALGASGPIVLGRAVVRDLYEGARAGRELSRMGTVMGIVPAVAPVLGGVLGDVAGWRSTFAVTVLLGAALGGAVLWLLPETLRTRAAAPLSLIGILREFRSILSHPAYRVYVALCSLTYAGLFAFISGSSFVLQGIYGLDELPYAFSFAFTVAGYVAGTLLAQRLVGRHGLDRTIGAGAALMALGGAAMLILVLLRAPSSLAITGPMALYTAGVGLAMPQTIAAAMMPFGHRAGAASSLLGICQMSFAALVGAGLGQALGGSALPLTLTIAAIGATALGLFRGSAGIRRA